MYLAQVWEIFLLDSPTQDEEGESNKKGKKGGSGDEE